MCPQVKRKQLFVPLIEKAMAKLYGGYHKLIGGHISEAMTCLTGYPCEILWLPPNKKQFCSNQFPLDLTTTSVLNKDTKKIQRSMARCMEQTWVQILSYNSAGFMLSASCGRTFFVDQQNGMVKENLIPEEYQLKGLFQNHAYTVLDVVSVDEHRLVKLRNPWGTYGWNGDWCHNSSKWTPQLNNLLRMNNKHKEEEEGIFWMSFADLCTYFEQIIVCKIQPAWNQYGFEGMFPRSWSDTQNWNVYEVFAQNNQVSHVELMATLYVNQKTLSTHADTSQPELSLFMVIFELRGGVEEMLTPVLGQYVASSVCNLQNSVTLECELLPRKKYLMALFAFNKMDGSVQSENGYVLRVFTSKPVFIQSYQCPNTALVGDILIQFTKQCGEVFYVSSTWLTTIICFITSPNRNPMWSATKCTKIGLG